MIDRQKLLLAVNEAFDHDNPTVRSALDALLVALALGEVPEEELMLRAIDANDLRFGILYAEIAKRFYFAARDVLRYETFEEDRPAYALKLCEDYVEAVEKKAHDLV